MKPHPEVWVGGRRAIALHVDEPGRRCVLAHAQRCPQLLAQDARLCVQDLRSTKQILPEGHTCDLRYTIGNPVCTVYAGSVANKVHVKFVCQMKVKVWPGILLSRL